MGRQAKVTLVIEAVQSRVSKILDGVRNKLSGVTDETKNLSQAQARAARDTAYRKSTQFLIDRIGELGDRTKTTMRSIQTLSAGLQSTDKQAVDEYRAAVQRIRDRIDELEVKNESLKKSQAGVTEEVEKSGVAGNALSKVWKRLLAAGLLFVSARRINRFFRESVNLFIENAEGAGELRERIEDLKDAWFDLRVAIGSVIVEIFSLDKQSNEALNTTENLTKSINENRKGLIRWGRIAVESVVLVLNGFKQLFDTVTTGWKLLLLGAELAAREIRIVFKKLANQIEDDFKNAKIFAPSRFLAEKLGLPEFGGRTFDTSADEKAVEGLREEIRKLDEESGIGKQLEDFRKAARAGRERVNAPIGDIPVASRPRDKEKLSAEEKRKREMQRLRTEIERLQGELFEVRARRLKEPFDEALAETEADLQEAIARARRELGDLFEAPPKGLTGQIARRRREAGLNPLERERERQQQFQGKPLPERPFDAIEHPSSMTESTTDFGGGFGAHFQRELEKTFGPLETLDQKLASIAAGSLAELGDQFENVFFKVSSGSASAGEAAAEFFTFFIAKAASELGDFHFAQGIAKLASGTWPPNAAAIKASGLHFAAAGAFKALSGTLRGSVAGRGGGGAGGAGLFISRGSTRAQERLIGGRGRGTATIIIQGGILDMNDPRQERALANALNKLDGRDVVIQSR